LKQSKSIKTNNVNKYFKTKKSSKKEMGKKKTERNKKMPFSDIVRKKEGKDN